MVSTIIELHYIHNVASITSNNNSVDINKNLALNSTIFLPTVSASAQLSSLNPCDHVQTMSIISPVNTTIPCHYNTTTTEIMRF